MGSFNFFFEILSRSFIGQFKKKIGYFTYNFKSAVEEKHRDEIDMSQNQKIKAMCVLKTVFMATYSRLVEVDQQKQPIIYPTAPGRPVPWETFVKRLMLLCDDEL